MAVKSIQVNDEYAKLVHPLSEQEYSAIKLSIKESNGNIVPIIVNQENVILDGHHRYRACNELNIQPKTEVKEFNSTVEEKKFVYEINLRRRHLNDFQRAELIYGLEEIYREEAKIRQLSNLRNVNVKTSSGSFGPNENTIGRTSEIVSRQAGISATIYKRAKKIIEEGTIGIKQKLRQGKTTISKEYQKIQIEQERKILTNTAPKIDLPEGFKLYNGDFEEVGRNIPNDSIDLIFTDPPYRLEDLELYEKLGIFANRVLKHGGSLVTFIGQYELLKIGEIVQKSGLKYLWPICVKHTGHYAKMRGFGTLINVAWKPLLWFVKGDKTSNLGWIVDMVESEPPKKIAHEWEQSTVEAEHVIKGLTVENQIVLDSFMGSGTTGIAALQLGRKFIGIELDSLHYSTARNRLSNRQHRNGRAF